MIIVGVNLAGLRERFVDCCFAGVNGRSAAPAASTVPSPCHPSQCHICGIFVVFSTIMANL